MADSPPPSPSPSPPVQNSAASDAEESDLDPEEVLADLKELADTKSPEDFEIAKSLHQYKAAISESLGIESLAVLMGRSILDVHLVALSISYIYPLAENDKVEPLDPTLVRFFKDEEVVQEWYLEDLTHSTILVSLLRLINATATEKLGDSRLLNSEASVINVGVAEGGSELLDYALSFWAYHASKCLFDQDTSKLLLDFFHKHALHLLELLSLKGKLVEAMHSLAMLQTACIEAERNDLSEWCQEIISFTQCSDEIITKAASEVRHSALSFTPHNSILRKHYSHPDLERIRVLSGLPQDWPPPTLQNTGTAMVIVYSPDGSIMASGTDSDNIIRLWDAKSYCFLRDLTGHTDWVPCLKFSPDGKILASGSCDKSIIIWDYRRGTKLLQFSRHTEWIGDLHFSPDSSTITSIAQDCGICTWEVATGSLISLQEAGDIKVMEIKFSNGGDQFLSGSATADDTACDLWNLKDREYLGTFEGHDGRVGYAAFSPDDKMLATASEDSTVRLWDVESQKCLETFAGFPQKVTSLAFSNNGKYVATGAMDSFVSIWDAHTGEQLGEYKVHDGWVFAVTFSPDDLHVVSGAVDCTIQFYPMEKFLAPRREGQPDQQGEIKCLAISEDQKLVASGSRDGSVIVWDATTGNQVGGMKEYMDHPIRALALSPDNLRLAAGLWEQTVTLFSLQTFEPIKSLGGLLAPVKDIVFSPNNNMLAATSSAYVVQVWRNVSAEHPISAIELHASIPLDDPIMWLEFHTDKYLASDEFVWDLEENRMDESGLEVSGGAPKSHLWFNEEERWLETSKNVDAEGDENDEIAEKGKKRLAIIPKKCYARRYEGAWVARGDVVVFGATSGVVTIIDCKS